MWLGPKGIVVVELAAFPCYIDSIPTRAALPNCWGDSKVSQTGGTGYFQPAFPGQGIEVAQTFWSPWHREPELVTEGPRHIRVPCNVWVLYQDSHNETWKLGASKLFFIMDMLLFDCCGFCNGEGLRCLRIQWLFSFLRLWWAVWLRPRIYD